MAQPTVQQAIDLAKQLHQAGKLSEAEGIYRQILAGQPNHPEALHLLGVLAAYMGRHETALGLIGRAIGIQPRFPQAFNNLGLTLHAMGRFDEAKAAYEQAISIWPDYSIAHFNLSSTLLLLGDFENGWRELEWRWQTPQFAPLAPKTDRPVWDGSELNGKRILIHAEQGFGDTIQFARYIPLVARRGGKVIFQCHNELLNLMRGLNDVDQLITHADALPEFDVHCSLLSLPRIFSTNLQSIPHDIPYLKADSSKAETCRTRLNDSTSKKKIGLAWAGRPEHNLDRYRSLSAGALQPMVQFPDASFFSLQKESSAQPKSIIDWTNELRDFTDTAALIDSLDLVISVDTAVAHLAGALGKPVWLLLPFVPDWRWLLNRTDSPWYPTIRLFRQPTPGDWNSPIEQIAQALQSWQS
jgi:hypothetical protein